MSFKQPTKEPLKKFDFQAFADMFHKMQRKDKKFFYIAYLRILVSKIMKS